MNYIVTIAEYNNTNDEGLTIYNSELFDNPGDASQFIVDDYDDTMEMINNNKLDINEINEIIGNLKLDESYEWRTPVEVFETEIVWKVFAK